MARRALSILDNLIGAAWRVSVACSAGGFVVLRFAWPFFVSAEPADGSNLALKGILSLATVAAPFVALCPLIPASIAVPRRGRTRRLCDSQEGLATIRALASWPRFETLGFEEHAKHAMDVGWYALMVEGGNWPIGESP